LVVKVRELISAGLLTALLSAAAANFALGKPGVVIEGVAVQQNVRYQYDPDAKDCRTKSRSYLLFPSTVFRTWCRKALR
jgi:hypothetical protein